MTKKTLSIEELYTAKKKRREKKQYEKKETKKRRSPKRSKGERIFGLPLCVRAKQYIHILEIRTVDTHTHTYIDVQTSVKRDT